MSFKGTAGMGTGPWEWGTGAGDTEQSWSIPTGCWMDGCSLPHSTVSPSPLTLPSPSPAGTGMLGLWPLLLEASRSSRCRRRWDRLHGPG